MKRKKEILKKYRTCIKFIMQTFIVDTLILVNQVLQDSIEDPQFSARTVCHRLKQIIFFEKVYFDKNYKTIWKYLRYRGYTEKDITALKQKCITESQFSFNE